MRKLTLKRGKDFVASLMKYQVYIEDPENGELVIKGTNCRKLGTVANGEDAVFEIGDGAAKLFVIGDKMAKDYCNDFFQIPEGGEDIILSGKATYNPTAGNPFYFDGNEDNEEAMENRKKSKRRGLLIFIIIFALCLLAGVGVGLARRYLKKAENNKEKEFSKAGMTITLTKAFSLQKDDEFDFSAVSSNTMVSGIKYPFSEFEGANTMTAYDLASRMRDQMGVSASSVKTQGSLIYYDYKFQETASSPTFKYRVYTFKTGNAFWLVVFGSTEKTFDSKTADFEKWVKTVKFA